MDNKSLAEKFEEKLTYGGNVNIINNQAQLIEQETILSRHKKSLQDYPEIDVDDDEYVVLSIRRHSVGYIASIIISAIIGVFLISTWIIICFIQNGRFTIPEHIKPQLSIIFGSLTFLLILITYANYVVYRRNRLVVTNERAIQWIQNGIMNSRKQVINLESIEDISYTKEGLMQHMFDYGTVRLSTVGDESTYTFIFTPNPDKKAEFLGDIVEAAKNKKILSDQLYNQGLKISVK